MLRYISEKHNAKSALAECVEKQEFNLAIKNSKEMESLFRTAYFVAREGMSFLKYERLCILQSLNGLELGKNYHSNNGCRRFISSIASDIKDDLRSNFNKCRFITVMSDGSTDKGINIVNFTGG